MSRKRPSYISYISDDEDEEFDNNIMNDIINEHRVQFMRQNPYPTIQHATSHKEFHTQMKLFNRKMKQFQQIMNILCENVQVHDMEWECIDLHDQPLWDITHIVREIFDKKRTTAHENVVFHGGMEFAFTLLEQIEKCQMLIVDICLDTHL